MIKILNFLLALLLILSLSSFFLIISIVLILEIKSNPFFTQFRVGKNQKLFKIYKFKTMRDLSVTNKNVSSDFVRITKFGNILRKSSLDELPQLVNIIKGEMSFVGPRPLLPEYLSLYSLEQLKRHNVLPGITGWAQVNGRNTISWSEKFKLDIWYVENKSLLLDLKIIFLTVKKVFNMNDINTSSTITMIPFNGKN